MTSIPGEIGKLGNLQVLYLGGNQLTSIPGEIGNLGNLQKLDLYSNQLTSIPEEITELDLEIKWGYDSGKGSFLGGNPLESPPVEIVKQGRDAVIEYFKSLEEAGEQPLNEVKVLLVGDGGAGKTSLMKQLLGEEFDRSEKQTHGINIRDWESGDIKVHFWDFGGQEIMHATHQFFLSRRSLYILVLDGRKEEKTEYWLKHIESFGGDSPVLVVINKIDENPKYEINRKLLQDKYKCIKGFYRVSCKEGTGIESFSGSLGKALTEVELRKITWAKSWFNVKTQLENMTCDFSSYDDYEKICNKEGITKKSTQDTLIGFLNDLGVILHFRDFELLNTLVLEPGWVTAAVYKIITSDELNQKKGVLELNSLDEILRQEEDTDYFFPRDTHRFIIDLMKKFELCYTIGDNNALVPDLLGVQEPEFDFDCADSLKFLIEYDFLPKSVMSRFIVRRNGDIKDDLQWRTGVVLEDENYNSTAVVKSDDEAKKIYIYVNGEQKRDYFSVVRKTFLDINNSFEKIDVKEMVPCNCSECSKSEEPYFYDYSALIKFYLKNIKEIPCSLSAEYVSIEKLLEGIERTGASKEEEILRVLRKLKTKTDTIETLLKKAEEDPILLQPNIWGMGVDLKKVDMLRKLANRLFDKEEQIRE
ncbi:MAG: hypothetical protein A7316_10690 [Candidatus Altiarchaeales archaeon WOR_SM1_86-2]|nr:MAG: hypothetical protein A7316_10690 [Candidatus Altiarchaeales archaeon WOR_SM1_86-2]